MADDELPFRYIPPPDPNLGRRVDTYFIMRILLGKGGMGAAYLAEHEALAHIKCVIKVVLVEMARHPMIISRYHNEAKALALLRHDNIVKLQGLGVLDDGQLYLRFEYVEGKSLDRYIAEHGGRLPLRKAVNFVFQLCWALQHAHDRGVIHRDLKPDNMIIEVDPPGSHVKERIKILDFGIAKIVSGGVDVTGSGIQMGTPAYMAPEQVTNATGVDGRADVFSLAQVLYKMVTGSLPWGSPDNSVEIYHRQRTQAPAMPAADLMPPEVVELVFRALSIHADDRPTAHEFAIELASRIKNGTDLLAKVVPDWAATTPPHATTLPRPAEPTPPAVRSPMAGAPALAGSGTPPSSVALLPPEAVAPEPVKDITSHARRRAFATPASPVAIAAPRSPALTTPATLPLTPLVTPPLPPYVPAARSVPAASQRPATPILAVLPTGLASQQFAAQEPPVEVRVPQAEVSAEIEMATGTPGPLPYAHAELPAVLVSHTQLSGLTAQASAPGVSPPDHRDHREPPPFVVLPGARRAMSRGKVIALGGAALVFVTAVSFAITLRGSRAPTRDENERSGVLRGAGSALSVTSSAPDAGAPSSAPTQPAPGAVTSPDPLTKHDPPTQQDGQAEPGTGTVNARPADAAPVDASIAGTRRERKASSTARSPDAPAGGPPIAAPQRQPAETASDRPARVDSKRPGKLTILVKPWALVWLDGKSVDQAPLVMDDVPAGRHRLRLKNDIAKKDETITVTVTAGQTTTVQRTW